MFGEPIFSNLATVVSCKVEVGVLKRDRIGQIRPEVVGQRDGDQKSERYSQ